MLSEFLAYIGFCADSFLSCFRLAARACCRHVPFTLAARRKYDSIRSNKTGSKGLRKHRTLIKKGKSCDRRKRGVPWGTDGKGDPFHPLSAHVLAAMLPVPVGGRGHPPADAGGRNGTQKKREATIIVLLSFSLLFEVVVLLQANIAAIIPNYIEFII